MFVFRKKITEERRENLERIIQEIVDELKARGDIECIFYNFYKCERDLSKTGNEFYMQLVYNGEVTDEVMQEFRRYNEKYLTREIMNKTGVEIIIYPKSIKYFKFLDPSELDFSKGYPIDNHSCFQIRCLYTSTIIYDKDGLYNQMAHQFDEYYDMESFVRGNKNKINIDINVEKEM